MQHTIMLKDNSIKHMFLWSDQFVSSGTFLRLYTGSPLHMYICIRKTISFKIIYSDTVYINMVA